MKKAYTSPKILSFNIADSLNVYSVSGYCVTGGPPNFESTITACTSGCTSTCSANKSSSACSAPSTCSGTIQTPASCP